MIPHDPTERFSNRVAYYVRSRPGYPAGIIPLLEREVGLSPGAVMADAGSGTGISSALFLEYGCTVFGIEPNREMREEAERLLLPYPRFQSIVGCAEDTTLQDRSVDFVVAGQAFHWFDPPSARREFARILRPGGAVILLWNTRRIGSSAFLRDYEALLQRFGTDYAEVRHRNIEPDALQQFFTPGTMAYHTLYNEQRFDLEGLTDRLLSSSYVPAEGHTDHGPMLQELQRIFSRHEREGQVVLEYDTEVFTGSVHEV